MGWKVTLGGTRRELTAEQALDPFETKWEGGTVVDFDDLSPETFDALANADGVMSWWGIYKFPREKASMVYAVVCAAAQHADVEPPPKPTNMREHSEIADMLERTPELEDQPMVGDFPRKPDATEIGSSSGAPGDSDGSPRNADENESVTS